MNLKKFLLFGLVLILGVFLLKSQFHTRQVNKIPGSYKAMKLMNDARAYPEQEIPSEAFGKAIEYDQTHFKSSENRAPVDPWESMGPINTAGRTLALAINPQADSTVYLGSASGGLWRSRKLGEGISWEYMPTMPGVLGVSAIAFANGDSTQMYIGTGEVYNNEITGNDGAYRATRGSYGVGILKSTDGGETWTKSLDWTYQNQKGVQALQVDKNDEDILFAATTDGVYRSTNAGGSWELVLNVPMATDIEINGDNITAICGNLGTIGRGIYNSFDGGDEWFENADTDIPSNYQGKGLLASAPNNPNVMYASIGNGFSSANAASWLLRSDDAGVSWTLMNTADYSKWQGWFSHDVAVDPLDENNISVVGTEVWGSLNGGADMQQRANGGVTLGNPEPGEPDGSPNYSHSDHHVTMFHPNIPNLILYGNDGGLFLSDDSGISFRSSNGGLQTTQYYNGFSVSHQNPEFAMGGLQDNSTSIHRGDGRWQRAIGGDGSWTGINFNDDNIVYGSYQVLNIARSNNNGQSNFSFLNIPHQGNPIFIAPYQISESNPNIIYGGGEFVYKTTDGGDTWDVMNGGQPLGNDPIYAMAISSSNPDLVYASTAPYDGNGELFRTTDGGDTWTNVTNGLPDRFINDIYFYPGDDATCYVVLSGFGSGHIYFTDNFGEDWYDISDGLPDVPTNAILVDNANYGHLYLGNDLGVYYSLNNGQQWEDFNEGLRETTIAMDLEISPMDRKIWVATHGKGVFRRDLIGEPLSANDQLAKNFKVESIYPNPLAFGESLNLKIESDKRQQILLELYDTNGTLIKEKSFTLNNGSNKLILESIEATRGIYHLKCTNEASKIISKSIFIKG